MNSSLHNLKFSKFSVGMSEQYFKQNSEVNPIELEMVEMFTQLSGI